MKFEYPVDGISDPDQKLGCNNIVGTYPIGRLFNWHGGVHVAENSSSPIKAIADGTLIAYRIPNSALQVGESKYSNGFVLLQHEYKSPKGRKLVFYSLYSGLLSFSEMKANKRYPSLFHIKSTTVQGTEIKNGKIGENLRKKSRKESVIRLVENGSKVVVGDKFLDKYYEILKIDGKPVSDAIMWADSLPNLVDGVDAEMDKIISGNDFNKVVFVKVGQELGFAGTHGFKGNKTYKTAHVEVFTDKDPSEFLKGIEGDKDDVKDTKKFLKFAKGSKLSLKYPATFYANDEIQVLEFPEGENEEYCRIKLHKQIRIVLKADLKYTKGSEKKEDNKVIAAKYTPEKLENLNKVFNDTLQSTSEIEWIKSLPGEEEKREVSFCPPAGNHIYWVKKTELGVSEKPTAPISLSANLKSLFKNKPGNKTESELGEDYFVQSSQVKKVTQAGSDKFFYDIKTMTPVKDDKGFVRSTEVQGFIKSDDANISEVSAHDWTVFGFETFKDQEDEFVFNKTVEILKQENAPGFIKTVWKQIDKDGNKILSSKELASGLGDEFVVKKLSKMICYHTSEWGLKYSSLQSEIETLLDEGINKEENADKKNALNQKKDLTITNTKQKVDNLQFWSKVKVPIPKTTPEIPPDWIYDPIRNQSRKRYPWDRDFEYEQEEEEYTPFPISPKVYHFHPIAFVEQMRRMGGCCSAKMNKEELKTIAYDSKDSDIEKHLPGLNEAFKNNSINTCLRKVHFLAQIIHESARLSATKEGGVLDSDYGGFPGRGLIQITGESNYKAYQTFSGEDVTTSATNKAKLESSPHAANSAGWFWDKKAKLNDEADENDFIYITMKINGGLNGYNHRLEYLKKGFLTYYTNCNIKKEISTEYKFNESKAYDNPIYAFAWGLWHDPDLEKTGCTKDKDEALKGYNRLINLTDSNYKIKNRYLIHKMSEFSDLKDTEDKVKVREAAQKRINKLNEN
ncbi:hypothetical protein BZG02_15930 [Labilibaculum filiforme]|uniref:EF-hand domain-containing protein n=1 Tax=Labilibaculum filiforme TaxID=1940526 RepID=A0A2N3HTT2_9BACT|nr:hypothetical protein [Labilibaculum filiforme]PKQ61441.1 hypothetical protein BZG02_15930 [Labilibaculum filiforme]